MLNMINDTILDLRNDVNQKNINKIEGPDKESLTLINNEKVQVLNY